VLGGLPFLWFQLQHSWPFLEFSRNMNARTGGKEQPLFISGQLVLHNPVSAFVWIPGLWALFRDDALRRFRAFGWAYATPYAGMNEDMLEQVGWPRFVRTVEHVVDARRGPTVVLTGNYGEAGALEVLGEPGVPVWSGHNSYSLWGGKPPPPADATFVTVGISRDPGPVVRALPRRGPHRQRVGRRQRGAGQIRGGLPHPAPPLAGGLGVAARLRVRPARRCQ
jgi:hypothetical protein